MGKREGKQPQRLGQSDFKHLDGKVLSKQSQTKIVDKERRGAGEFNELPAFYNQSY